MGEGGKKNIYIYIYMLGDLLITIYINNIKTQTGRLGREIYIDIVIRMSTQFTLFTGRGHWRRQTLSSDYQALLNHRSLQGNKTI